MAGKKDIVEQALKLIAGGDDAAKRIASIRRSEPFPADYIEPGSVRYRYEHPDTSSFMEIITRPKGARSASVIGLEVPEEYRGTGIGKALQERVLQDYPSLMGQVSSKAAAVNAYKAGRRPLANPNATLEDVFKMIDEDSSVNLATEKNIGGSIREGYQTKGRVVGDIVEQALKLVMGAEPQKTVKAYKLFKQREGKLYPLFVDANEEVPVNQWLKAKAGEQAASGKVKSKLGELAYRPGWHAGDLPVATHIGARSHKDPKLPPDTRPSDQVWAEVEMADDVDWQKVANERARITKKGTPDPKTAQITDQVPYGGYYRYKTNPNMTGNWMIGGDMRVNRVLTDDEVKAINEAAGVADLPRREGYGPGGWVDDVVKIAGKVISGEGEDAAKTALRQSVQQATDIPAHLRPGFKVEAAPGADEETRNLVDYLSQRDPSLSFDPQSLAERREDLGVTVPGFHGSPRSIERFTNQYSSPEGYWGGHHYFTTSPVDASVNYATPEGADLFRRLEGSIERTLDSFHPSDVTEWYAEKYGSSEGINPMDPKIVKEYADDIARQELGITNEGAVYPVNLRMKNPVKIDSPNQTFWGYDTQYDEAGDIVSEGGPAADLFQATRDALADYNVRDGEADELIGKLYERAIDYGGIDAKSYNDILRGSHMDLYDEDGNMVSMGHVMADAFRRMGHDSIDMPTDVFAGGLGRVGMAGTGGDTRHYIIFDPKNVRSRFGAFDPFKAASERISDAKGGAIEGAMRAAREQGGVVGREGYASKGRVGVVKGVIEGIADAVTGRSPNRVFPELAERYPEVKAPVKAFDKKTGKEYLAKDLSPEALAVEQARKVIQKDIDAGLYEPFFDVKARADVDPFNYPSTGKTIDVKPVKPETQAKYRAMAFDPEGLARLREGYTAGLEQKDVAENWYFVKQLEDKFVEEYGPEEGRRLFKERFAKPMALTTGGADPTSNLLMSYYGNFLREKGLPIPEAAYEMPYPIGGRFASPNMGMFGRNMEKELTPDNPKRLNFQNNFLGYKEPTIDEQMSKGFDPKLQMPEWYGPYEEAINMLAREYEVDPRYFQEVAWAGLKSKGKGGYQGMPMIQHINEAIERTSRLTGVPPEDVVRRGLVRGEMPIYGIAAPAGALAVGAMGEDGEEDIDNAVRIAKGNGGAFTKIVKSLFGPAEREGLEALTEAGSGYKGVPGKPDVVKIPLVGEVEAKPLRPIEQAAKTYMQRLGRPGAHRIDVFNPLDEELAAKVAEEYGKMKHDPTDPAVKRAYDALAQETLDQLEAAKGAGVDFTFVKGEDPYKLSPSLGYADLAERGHMYVFPTEQGFGSDVAFDPANNPLLKRIGPLGDLENATVNDAFRIVHDLYGHYGPGNPFFRAPGEERAFKLHSKMYSPEALPAMASETRGQNSWLNFGPYGRYNRAANAAETIYADQKTGIMPPWTYEKADGGAIDDAIRVAKDVGGSASQDDMQETYAALESATVPPSAAPVEPRYPDKAARQMAAIKAAIADAMGGISRDREPTDLEYWNALSPETREELIAQYPELKEQMRLANEVNYYENAQRAKASQPYDTQSMTHEASIPRTEMKVNLPLFGGEYSIGSAPYNVAEGLQNVAQTAYDFKTMPAYFFPATAPFALGADILESRLADDPTGFLLNAAFTPAGGKLAKEAVSPIVKKALSLTR